MAGKKTLGEVATYINGRAFKPTEWENIGRPIIRIQNLNNTTHVVNRTRGEFEKKYLIEPGDLLFAWSGSLGAHIWDGEEGWLNQHIFKVIPNPGVDKYYLYYFLHYIINQLYAKTHGSGMVHITLKPFKATPIHLPDLKEQQRIVDKIQSLFARLDEARDKLQQVLEGTEARRAAIFHEAFSGGWGIGDSKEGRVKSEEGVQEAEGTVSVPEGWKVVRFGDCIQVMQNGLSKRKGDKGIPTIVLRLTDLKNGLIDTSEGREILLNEDEIQKYKLDKNDALMIRVNGSKDNIAKQFIFDGSGTIAFCDHLIRIKYKENINPRYMTYYAQTYEYKKYVEANMVSSAGQNTISRKGMKDLLIPIPSKLEQNLIVESLNFLCEGDSTVIYKIKTALAQIDLLKKAILARAFRGELGTGDPEDPSALELLKQSL